MYDAAIVVVVAAVCLGGDSEACSYLSSVFSISEEK